jgi:LysR family transcriptional regulator, benzoate and cis,cis-muconate-responsive activator of ben and cat genes
MSSNKLNLKQLRYFCEVVNTGNARSAAEKLFVAPTAISMQLSALEDILGGQLLDRSSRPMALTSLGQFVYPKAQELLGAVERLQREAQGIASGNKGWLSIGFTRSSIFSILPDAVRAMQSAYPDVRIDLAEVLTEHQAERLRSGAIHLGIGRTIGPHIAEADMNYCMLFEDPLVAAVPMDHRLGSELSIRAHELSGLPYISYPGNANSHFSRQVLAILQAAGADPQIGYEAKEIHTALGLVAAGLGCTLVGQSVSQNNRTDIRFLRIADISAQSSVFAIRMQNSMNPLVDVFLDIVRQQVRSYSLIS